MPYVDQWVYVLNGLLAVIMVLWGLRLFKVYIIIFGILLGAGLGALLGMAIGHSSAAAILGAILGGIAGGFIAWPLQKILIFIAAGIAFAALGMLLAALLEIPQQNWWVAGAVAFFVGGGLILAFYEPFIIVMFSYGAAQGILPSTLSQHIWMQDPQDLIGFYLEHLAVFMLVSLVYVGFGLYFQRVIEFSPADSGHERELKTHYRRAVYLLAGLALLAYLADCPAFSSQSRWSLILGLNLMSWPLIAFLANLLMAFLRREYSTRSPRAALGLQIGFALLISLALMPLCDWLVASIAKTRLQPLDFYALFFKGPAWVIACKWLYSLLVFPCLFFSLILHWKPSQKTMQKAAGVAEGTSRLAHLGPGLAPGKSFEGQLTGLSGAFVGEKIPLGQGELILGRDPSACNIVFPPDSPLVSRRHASLRYNPSRRKFILEDLGSSIGTFMETGDRILPGKPRPLPPGTVFYLGSKAQSFKLTEK